MSYDIRIGDNLDERFQITELIQKSGMSTIYKAIDCTNGQIVAIKVPHMQLEAMRRIGKGTSNELVSFC